MTSNSSQKDLSTKISDGIKLLTQPLLIALVIGFGQEYMKQGEQIISEVKSLRIAITEQKKDIDFLRDGDKDKEIRLRQLEITSYKGITGRITNGYSRRFEQ